MRAKILLVLMLSLLLPMGAGATIKKMVTVRGEVANFDSTWVTLSGEAGPVIVPRKSIPSDVDVRPGKQIEVKIDLDELVKVNRERMKYYREP